jgi:hypothetical protein
MSYLHEYLRAVPVCACMREGVRGESCLPDPQCVQKVDAAFVAEQETGQLHDLCACGEPKLAVLSRCYGCIRLEANRRRSMAVASARVAVAR